VRGGVARLHGAPGAADRWMRAAYQAVAPVHDPLLALTLPLFQGRSETEGAARTQMVDRLELGALQPSPTRPRRILDVGVGSGRLLPWLDAALPADVPTELWGVDLSPRMMAAAFRIPVRSAPRLLLADAHALPFPDGAFDRVIQVGGVGGFTDPAAAIAEMWRVAAPGARLLLVDEQLDPARTHSWVRRALFRAVTFYQSAPASPVALVPTGAVAVRDEPLSRFFYCLSFRKPDLGEPAHAA
jgi:SAM-dependent methyltransferase